MPLKLLLRLSLSVVIIAGVGLVGCSDDNQRVTVTGSEDSLDQLATGVDDADNLDSYYDYISDGFYYPDDVTGDEDMTDPGGQDLDDDDPSDKPIDNGLGEV